MSTPPPPHPDTVNICLLSGHQMKAEREAFRERDLAAVRLQMTSTHRRETEAVRKELQSQYDARVERLRETERERERRDKDRLRDAEVSQFEARQNLLREMDLLRTREQVGNVPRYGGSIARAPP